MLLKKIFLFSVLIYLVGCSSKTSSTSQLTLSNPAEASTSVSEPTVKSEALPDLPTAKKLPPVDSVNDLIDNYHFDGDGVKVRLVVKNDKACFLWIKPSTPDTAGELVMEALKRDKLGLWKGINSERLFTQSAPNQLDVYSPTEELQASYTNSSVTKELTRAASDYKERTAGFDVLLRSNLNKSKVARAVYSNQCAQVANFYYREELPPLNTEQKHEFQRESESTKQS
jgi:hypothetical protein